MPSDRLKGPCASLQSQEHPSPVLPAIDVADHSLDAVLAPVDREHLQRRLGLEACKDGPRRGARAPFISAAHVPTLWPFLVSICTQSEVGDRGQRGVWQTQVLAARDASKSVPSGCPRSRAAFCSQLLQVVISRAPLFPPIWASAADELGHALSPALVPLGLAGAVRAASACLCRPAPLGPSQPCLGWEQSAEAASWKDLAGASWHGGLYRCLPAWRVGSFCPMQR